MLQYLIITIISICFFYVAPNTMERDFMTIVILIVVSSICLHFYKEKKYGGLIMRRLYFRHSIFFILFFSIVFFQYNVDYILGFVGSEYLNIWIDTGVVCKSLALSCACLNATLAGYWYYRLGGAKKISNAKRKYSTNMEKILSILIVIFLVFYIIVVDKSYLNGGYAKVEEGKSFVIMVLLQSVFLTIFAVYSYRYRQNIATKSFIKFFRVPLMLLTTYIIIILITGRRTEAVRMFSLLFVVYLYCKGTSANYKRIMLLGLFGVILFSSVALLRTSRADNFSQAVKMKSNELTISPFTQELAGSVNTLHVAVENFPKYVNYTYGLTFFPDFLVLIPGMERLYLAYFTDGVKRGTARIITELNFGDEANYGMGSSIVADTYISFGPILSTFFFFLLGIYICYLELGTFCYNKSPYFLIMSFCSYSQIPYACRGSMSSLFLSLSYALILYFVMLKLVKR